MKLLPEVYQALILLGVIVFGSIVHATSQLKISRDAKTNFTKIDFLILFILALFAGGVFGLIATILFEQQYLVILFSAVGSFLGMAGLNRVANILLDILSGVMTKK